jgi:hypothetical protein
MLPSKFDGEIDAEQERALTIPLPRQRLASNTIDTLNSLRSEQNTLVEAEYAFKVKQTFSSPCAETHPDYMSAQCAF